jgi:hypothetical protein
MIMRFAALTLAFTVTVHGAEYARYLLPVHVPHTEILGTGSTRWRTELTVANTSAEDIIIGPCAPGFPENPSAPCPPMLHLWRAHAVLVNPSVGWTQAGDRGRFVWMLASRVPDVQMDLAVLRNDVLVAKLPVVSNTAFSAKIQLLNVPLRNGKATLRVYGLDNRPTAAHVRVTGAAGVLAEMPITLAASAYVDPAGLPYAPSYAEMAIDTFTNADSVQLEITSDDEAPVWAFVTVNGTEPDRLIVIAPFPR